MSDSTKSISPLRQRMIDDMTMRKLSPKTQVGYLRAVTKFTRFFGQSPDLASSGDLRAFQLHLAKENVSSTTINATITGLSFFFGVSLDCPSVLKQICRVHEPQRLPQVLSVDEVERLLAGASNPKYRAALAVAYGAGLRASEVVHLKVTDIDSERMIVRVNQGKGQRDRYIIATKFGNVWQPGLDYDVCGRPDYVMQACAESLQRLGIDTIVVRKDAMRRPFQVVELATLHAPPEHGADQRNQHDRHRNQQHQYFHAPLLICVLRHALAPPVPDTPRAAGPRPRGVRPAARSARPPARRATCRWPRGAA